MLQRTVTYSLLLRILGGCFLLYGLYVIVLALTAQTQVSGSIQYSGAMLLENAMGVENFLFYGGFFTGNPIVPGLYRSVNLLGPLTPGPLLWVGLGILCVSLSMRRAQVAYVGLQLTLWMISLSVWFPILWLLGSTDLGLGSLGPLFLITLALSLFLLAVYQPVIHGLRRLLVPQIQVL